MQILSYLYSNKRLTTFDNPKLEIHWWALTGKTALPESWLPQNADSVMSSVKSCRLSQQPFGVAIAHGPSYRDTVEALRASHVQSVEVGIRHCGPRARVWTLTWPHRCEERSLLGRPPWASHTHASSGSVLHAGGDGSPGTVAPHGSAPSGRGRGRAWQRCWGPVLCHVLVLASSSHSAAAWRVIFKRHFMLPCARMLWVMSLCLYFALIISFFFFSEVNSSLYHLWWSK